MEAFIIPKRISRSLNFQCVVRRKVLEGWGRLLSVAEPRSRVSESESIQGLVTSMVVSVEQGESLSGTFSNSVESFGLFCKLLPLVFFILLLHLLFFIRSALPNGIEQEFVVEITLHYFPHVFLRFGVMCSHLQRQGWRDVRNSWQEKRPWTLRTCVAAALSCLSKRSIFEAGAFFLLDISGIQTEGERSFCFRHYLTPALALH